MTGCPAVLKESLSMTFIDDTLKNNLTHQSCLTNMGLLKYLTVSLKEEEKINNTIMVKLKSEVLF